MNNKGDLEKQKLQIEIEEIKLKIESERNKIESEKNKGFRENLRSWATAILAFLAVGSGIVTLWIQSETFLRQKEREQNFVLNKEMITLVDQLNENDIRKQENAAILLSFFKKDAIPILLMNLERSQNPKATIESLKLIKENREKKPQEVLDPLIKSARKIFSASEIADDKDLLAFSNFVEALGELGKEKEKDVEELLNNLMRQVEEKKIKLTNPHKFIIKETIQKSVEKLRKNSTNLNFME